MFPAVFLDRDDTLIRCNELPPAPPPAKRGDLVDPGLVELLPDVLEACRALRAAGFRLVVISNQGAVARGAATLEAVEAVNDRLRTLLTPTGEYRSLVDAVYYCPYHPQGLVARFSREHPWRKPAPGMILEAAGELELDLSRSWLVGDAPRDVEAGLGAGLAAARCLLVGPESGLRDLASAARVILAESAP